MAKKSSNFENWIGVMSSKFAGQRVALRKKIQKKGPPDAIFVDKELDEEIRMWRVKGGVLTIPFREERPDIDRILIYTDEFIDFLMSVRVK